MCTHLSSTPTNRIFTLDYPPGFFSRTVNISMRLFLIDWQAPVLHNMRGQDNAGRHYYSVADESDRSCLCTSIGSCHRHQRNFSLGGGSPGDSLQSCRGWLQQSFNQLMPAHSHEHYHSQAHANARASTHLKKHALTYHKIIWRGHQTPSKPQILFELNTKHKQMCSQILSPPP